MLAYLKQGKLSELARQEAEGAAIVVDGSRRHLSTYGLDATCAEQAKPIGSASIMTVVKGLWCKAIVPQQKEAQEES